MERIPCKYCGREIPPDTNFCWYCGRQLISQAERPEAGLKKMPEKRRTLVFVLALLVILAITLYFVFGSGGY